MKYIFVLVLILYFGTPIKAQVLNSCEPKNVSYCNELNPKPKDSIKDYFVEGCLGKQPNKS